MFFFSFSEFSIYYLFKLTPIRSVPLTDNHWNCIILAIFAWRSSPHLIYVNSSAKPICGPWLMRRCLVSVFQRQNVLCESSVAGHNVSYLDGVSVLLPSERCWTAPQLLSGKTLTPRYHCYDTDAACGKLKVSLTALFLLPAHTQTSICTIESDEGGRDWGR